MDNIFFEVTTPLNVLVRTTVDYWNVITRLKHPVMQGKEGTVIEALKSPEVIRKSRIDDSVFLYYRQDGLHYICVIVKHLNNHGFIITCYRTDKIKIGDKVWPH